MRAKKYTKLIFFFFACIHSVYGQQSNALKKSYLRFEAAGVAGSQIKEITQGNIVYVYTSAGFIGIHSTVNFDDLSNKLYYKAYYNLKDKLNNQKKTEGESKLKMAGPAVYLYPDSEFCIDILEKTTDVLVCRYIIKRPRLVPEIKFYNLANGNQKPFYISTGGSQYDSLSLLPGEKVKVSVTKRNDFENLEVDYALVNLKTKRSVRGNIKEGFDSLKLEANTDYELRVNYTIQKELVGVISIKVKPYWYQSVIIYVILLVASLILAILLFAGSLKNKLSRSKKEQRKMEEAAIRLQSLLNPHFTFNALSSIQGLMNTNRIDDANLYLQEFSSLLRKTLAKSQQVYNNLDQELEMMRMYIRLEALRFNFFWDIEVDSDLSIPDIEIPTLILQPLIENAIKHGLSALGGKGKLLIVCKKALKEDTFVIIVEDNGIWLDNNSASGYGLSLTEERIDTINRLSDEQGIELEFNKQSGTQAILIFHNWINL